MSIKTRSALLVTALLVIAGCSAEAAHPVADAAIPAVIITGKRMTMEQKRDYDAALTERVATLK
jgi:hypothetical protein